VTLILGYNKFTCCH